MQNDYYDYFSEVWKETTFLKSFKDLEIDEILGEVRSKLNHNEFGLLLEPCVIQQQKDGDTYQSELTGGFLVLKNCRINDEKSRLEVLRQSYDYAVELITRLADDMACCGVFCGASLVSVIYTKQGAMLDNAFGTRAEFVIKKQIFNEKNEKLWR